MASRRNCGYGPGMNDKPARAILRRGRDSIIAKGHPWVFSGAIAALEGKAELGSTVDVGGRDQWLGRGLLNPEADLSIRIYSRNPDQPLDTDFFRERARAAVARRARLATDPSTTNAYRVVYSEADGLSGLVVDRYADVLSARVSARVLQPYMDAIRETLLETTGCSRWVVSTDALAREREGLTEEQLGAGGPDVTAPVRILQDGHAFEVDPRGGHKTGFYLDQRDNRRRTAGYARDARVLSAYCYTGAFEVYAAGAGAAEITGLDESRDALARAEAHHTLNELTIPVNYEEANVPVALRKYRDRGLQFDLIVLDPPRFVARRSQLEKGLRAYKDINLLAMKLLAPGGILATFSCSGLVSRPDFTRAVAWAASDSGREVRILETLGQPADHPILLAFPESAYLKGLLCGVE